MTTGIDGLPALPVSALPREVREGRAEDRGRYRAALGFERMLVAQLAQRVLPAGEDGEGSPYAGAVPDAFADALMTGGGLGLARQIHARIREGA